jgi:hypothetical protein
MKRNQLAIMAAVALVACGSLMSAPSAHAAVGGGLEVFAIQFDLPAVPCPAGCAAPLKPTAINHGDLVYADQNIKIGSPGAVAGVAGQYTFPGAVYAVPLGCSTASALGGITYDVGKPPKGKTGTAIGVQVDPGPTVKLINAFTASGTFTISVIGKLGISIASFTSSSVEVQDPITGIKANHTSVKKINVIGLVDVTIHPASLTTHLLACAGSIPPAPVSVIITGTAVLHNP